MSEAFGLLGLASRAHKISKGEIVFKQIRARKAYLVIISEEVGNNSKKKLIDKCTFYNIPYVYMNEDEMNQAIGDHNKKSVAIVDEGFALKLHTCLKG
ncbi:MAG: ribosomal L7Ae/L30e/S12e/Gadd45 family protein [Longicatena sp.]